MDLWFNLFNYLSLTFKFEDQYIEISTVLPQTSYLYGLGEHIGDLLLPQQTYTLWNRGKELHKMTLQIKELQAIQTFMDLILSILT